MEENKGKLGPLAGLEVITGLSDEAEREKAGAIMSEAGAASVCHAENGLELVLMALRYEAPVIICDTDLKVIDIRSALKYITGHIKYATIAVLADDWAGDKMDDLLGLVDVFTTRPVSDRSIVPGISVDAARKKRMKELDQEFIRSEADFTKDKEKSFAEHIIMDTLGLSYEGAGEYIASLAERNGYDESDAAGIMYEALIASGRSKL